MTTLQQKIVITWFIGPASALLALDNQNSSSTNWFFILLIGFGICRYLRLEFPKNTAKAFEGMSAKWKIIILIYYSIFAALTFYTVIYYPDAIEYNNNLKFIIFLVAFTFPLIPSWLKHEVYLYKWARNNVA